MKIPEMGFLITLKQNHIKQPNSILLEMNDDWSKSIGEVIRYQF